MTAVRGRRYLLILAVLAGLVGLYAAVGFLLVPRWMRSEVVRMTAEDYGRHLSLGSVRFNPFTWTLELSDLSFPDADGRRMIGFRRLIVALGLSSIPRLAPSFSDIEFEDPRIDAVVRRDGRLNLADLAKPFAGPSQPASPASRPFKLYIERLSVANGSTTYEDDSRPSPFRVELAPISFGLVNFSTSGSHAGSYHLTATIGQAGRLDWTGTVRARPLSLHGELALDALSARTVGEYLGPVLPAQVSRGSLALRGSFTIEGARGGAAAPGIRMSIDVPQAQVSGLGIRPWRTPADYVQVGRFALASTHIDLARHSIRVGQITLAGAQIRGWLSRSGKLNLLQLLGGESGPAGNAAAAPQAAPPGARPAAAPVPPHGAPWRIAAPDIRIASSRLSLQDRRVRPAAQLTLSAVAGRITGYDSAPRSTLALSLHAEVNGRGELGLTGRGTLQPAALSATLSLRRIDLRALQPYLNEYATITLRRGVLDSQIAVERRADGSLSAAGRIDVLDLRTLDDSRRDFVRWQGLHVVGLRYLSSPASLRIERIVAVAPYARVIIGPHRTLNVSEALHPRVPLPTTAAQSGPPAPAAASGRAPSAGSTSAAMPIAIGLVRIANGTADYADLSIQPHFATGIQDLHGAIRGLSSAAGSRARLELRGKVDRSGPVTISGVVNLLAARTYADVRMSFRGLELTRVTPYAVRFAGYRIASGTLDANLHYKVDHGRLDANHRLVINQLQLGERVASPHAVNLPLRLAVALLKDRNGVIRLGLPVTGSLDNPQFSLGPLIGKALLRVLQKAVTAPFAMLGRLFGGGADVNRIGFAPGSAALTASAHTQVAALAKALAQRPQLQLQVPATFAPDVDRAALAKRQLRDELLTLARTGALGPGPGRAGHGGSALPAGPEVLELPVAHLRLLRAAFSRTFGPNAPLPVAARKAPPFEPAIHALQAALLSRMRITDAQLQGLGERRAQAIRAALLGAGSLDPGRIGISAAAPQAAVGGQAVLKLGLK
jgi:uncharacterized protein involved in outer membrane biogenesis